MSSKDKKPASGNRGGIRTLADLNRHSTHDSDSDSDGAPQEYYAGGEKRLFLFLFVTVLGLPFWFFCVFWVWVIDF